MSEATKQVRLAVDELQDEEPVRDDVVERLDRYAADLEEIATRLDASREE